MVELLAMLEVEEKLTGAQLDRAIAERVMGWHEETDYDYRPPQVNWIDRDGNFRGIVNCEGQLANLPLWKPSESIKAAMQVQDRIAELGLQENYSLELARTNPAFESSTDVEIYWQVAHATAEQRCRAALAAVEQ